MSECCRKQLIASVLQYCEHMPLWCRINNAGTNGYKYKLLTELEDNDLANIVETNVLGVMLGCREVEYLLYRDKDFRHDSSCRYPVLCMHRP